MREPQKRALLIGAKYSETFFMGPLQPSHDDVWKVHRLLTKIYRYDARLIKVLIDDGVEEAPTKDTIVREMKKLLQESIAEDEFFLYFFGHAGQMECAPGDEDTDEAFIPCDATEDPSTWITDDDMQEMIVCKVPLGAELTAFFDVSPAVQKDLSSFVDTAILPELIQLDLTNCLMSMSAEATGLGGFSDVFRGRARIAGRGNVDVAIKRLRFHVQTSDCKRLFEQEMYVWSRLKHQNILPLLGYAFCGSTGYPLFISEWMQHGTAWSYVQANSQLTTSGIRDLVFDIAFGLSYLHDMDVVHSDLKADNVLISPGGRALISDFGCARMLFSTHSIAQITPTIKGTCQFWAPELLDPDEDAGDAKHSKESDVWSFGMTVYELLSKKRPYEGKAQVQVLMAIVLGRLPALPPAPHADENAALHRELLRLCEVCWMSEPNSRPRMSDVTTLDIFQASRGPLFDYDLTPPAVNSGSVDGAASGDCRVSIFGFEMPRTASPGPLDIQNFTAILGQFNPAETHGRRDLDVCNCAIHGPGESEGGQMITVASSIYNGEVTSRQYCRCH